MRHSLKPLLFSFAVVVSSASAQMPAQSPTAGAPAPVASLSRAPQPTKPFYVNAAALNTATILSPPAAKGSAAEAAELAEVHTVMTQATAAQTAAAQADAVKEDIFLYSSVLGPGFNLKDLPQTAALSAHLVNDARFVNLALKVRFGRVRPFRTDATLHPTCGLLIEPSYPSGHSMNGYLLAFALTQIVPEKGQEILMRADEYAHSRIVCGEHYSSDLTAGRAVALEIFGNILANPAYQQDLKAAREESRKALHLNP